MKMTFTLDCLWGFFLNSDEYQQQVRLAVRVARLAGPFGPEYEQV